MRAPLMPEGVEHIPDNPFLKIRARSLLLWLLVGLFIYGFVFAIIAHFSQVPLSEKTNENFFSLVVYACVFLWVGSRCKTAGINRSFFFKGAENVKPLHLIGLAVLLLSFSLGLVFIMFFALFQVSPSLTEVIFPDEKALLSESPFPALDAVLDALIVVLIAPVVEELLFRGILLNRWASKWGLRAGMVTSSLAFAVLHADIIGAFIFAICMIIVYLKTQTLLAPITIHVINNGIVMALTLADEPSPSAPGKYSQDELWSILQIGIICVAVTLPLLVKYIYSNWSMKKLEPMYMSQYAGYGGSERMKAAR